MQRARHRIGGRKYGIAMDAGRQTWRVNRKLLRDAIESSPNCDTVDRSCRYAVSNPIRSGRPVSRRIPKNGSGGQDGISGTECKIYDWLEWLQRREWPNTPMLTRRR